MSIRMLLRSSEIPENVKRAFRLAIVTECAEQVLWREAACRHVLDAFGVIGTDEEKAVDDARKWFRSCYDDVSLLFEFAGVDPAPIRKALVEAGHMT